MKIVIITGMSGAGKTTALNFCQDNDYHIIDNLPPTLLEEYIEIINRQDTGDKVAIGIDIRSGNLLKELNREVNKLLNSKHDVKIIYLDAETTELIKRFQENRRPHPYKDVTLEEAIEKERADLLEVREFVNEYIDTTSMKAAQLKNRIIFVLGEKEEFKIQVVSFGYKYGILKEADYLFDVRFIDNPFYIHDLKNKTGQDKEVIDYVISFPITSEFIDIVINLIEKVIPEFINQGKRHLVIGIGCTGGKHRSVVISEMINKILKEKYNSNIYHRQENNW
ncbi:MAG: RNase adapter RapZ [Helcococcus sp.]|nr:RNase adapter RapZ [Helcococcus sp.]